MPIQTERAEAESDRSAGINTWVAERLRGLADRLDGRTFETATQ